MKRLILLIILSLFITTASRAQLTCPDYALHNAVVEGYPEVLNIAVGLYANTGLCDINGKSPSGDTPLHLAVFLGKAEMVKILLDNDANTSIKNSYGNTVIEWAEATDNDEIKFLLRESVKKASQANLLSLFSMKEMEKTDGISIERIKMLIDAGADVNVRDPSTGQTALHMSSDMEGCIYSYQNPYLVYLLIDAGADVNAKNDFGRTPLDNAFSNYDWSYVDNYAEKCFAYAESVSDMLIEAGADVTHSLQHAIGKDKDKNSYVLKKLINAGADVPNAQITPAEYHPPGYYSTLLHRAIGGNHLEDAKTLIKAGADVNLKDSYGTLPLALVAEVIREVDTEKEANDVIETVEMLIEKGADVNISPPSPDFRTEKMLIDYLLTLHDIVKDENTNSRREIYRPDLIRKTYKDFMQILIEAGATQ